MADMVHSDVGTVIWCLSRVMVIYGGYGGAKKTTDITVRCHAAPWMD